MFLSEPIISKSGRLSLVPPPESDDAVVAILRAHPATRQYLRDLPTQVALDDAAARRLERKADGTLIEFHIHNATNEFLGSTAISRIDPAGEWCDVSIMVVSEHTRTGVATDALYTLLDYVFGTKEMNRAEFQTAADNVPMRGWLERTGAKLQGVGQEGEADSEGGGEVPVTCVYEILKQDWEGGIKEGLEKRIQATNGGILPSLVQLFVS